MVYWFIWKNKLFEGLCVTCEKVKNGDISIEYETHSYKFSLDEQMVCFIDFFLNAQVEGNII